jgi:fumarate hydratase class II
MKIVNDVRWYASGPRVAIGELRIPENEPGSSIMPGKINPSPCEALTIVAVQVLGNDHAVAFAGSQGELSTEWLQARHAAQRSHPDRAPCRCLAVFLHALRCWDGAERTTDQKRMLVTALNPHVGYEKAAKISLTDKTSAYARLLSNSVSSRTSSLTRGYARGDGSPTTGCMRLSERRWR